MSPVLTAVLQPTGFGIRAAIRKDGQLVEIQDADDGVGQVANRLFRARVRTVDRKLNAAFIDCGLPEPGFLTAKDARVAGGTNEKLTIDRLVHEGQTIIVQGLRESVPGKGARFTTDVRLFGVHVVLRPASDIVEVSGRLRQREQATLVERGAALFPEGGLLLRQLAAGASDDLLRAETERLRATWAAVPKVGVARLGPLAMPGDSPAEQLLRGLVAMGVGRLVVADVALIAQTRQFLADWPTMSPPEIEILRHDADAFAVTGVTTALLEALAVEVPLADGGRLVIEPTSALTAIDVDGGGREALAANLAAAEAIARQLRLRNIGGTIVVDFIDLAKKGEQMRLYEALRKGFSSDPSPVQIHPMSPLGLVEISRARRGQSLAQLLTRACPACEGTGHAPSLRAVAEQLYAALKHARGANRRVDAAPDLAHYLKRAGANAIGELAPVIQIDERRPAGTYAIVDAS